MDVPGSLYATHLEQHFPIKLPVMAGVHEAKHIRSLSPSLSHLIVMLLNIACLSMYEVVGFPTLRLMSSYIQLNDIPLDLYANLFSLLEYLCNTF
jgi:hypothetical protein